ncbi:MAG TPA: alpha-ketoglutarate-dependent dioxygenase AlkB [Egibacteraceae bacterium]|nr:alpha-ketoglutarate-dependent dioxygenase AlkB [Egibacteraceae bacterium]
MREPCPLTWQPSLLDTGDGATITFDPAFTGLVRRELAGGAWVDHVPGWVRGADVLFDALLRTAGWAEHTRWMYERRVVEPRLTARYHLDDGDLPLPVLAELAAALSERYGVTLTQVGANLYRDGADSVAWHGDRVARELPEATVALVSLGEPRPFRLRPKGGGPSVCYVPGRGDLLVMGGSCQRTWDHAVPKVRRAGPRMSVQFRHAYDR